MPYRIIWILALAFSLSACAAPTATPNVLQPESTLPPTTIATVATTVAAQPTDLPVAQPSLTSTEPGSETPVVLATESAPSITYQGSFVNMEVPSSGSFTLDPAANTLTLHDDFTTRSGPDLYVVLSGTADVQQHYLVFSTNVTNAPIQYLGSLTATSGQQTYSVPFDTDLTQFHTVVIWCKTYSVAFAAALIQ